MANILHSNNAVGYLLTGLTTGSTALVLQSGQGSRFPAISGDQAFFVTVEDRVLGLMEIMLCTSRTVDSLTVVRAQQGTPATAFSPGTAVSNRVTAGFLNSFNARIDESLETAEAAAVAAATALAAATQAQADASQALALTIELGNSIGGIASNASQALVIATQAQADAAAAQTKANEASSAAGVALGRADQALSLADTARQEASAATVTANAAQAAVADKANLDGPNFTGNTRVPTVGAGTNTTAAANTIFVNAAIAAAIATAGANYAPILSPDFQGVPKVPTAAAGTNTTQAASTAYVVNSIGEATVAFAPILSPDFQGVPKVPTAAPGTATTQAASTAFVGATVSAAIAAIPPPPPTDLSGLVPNSLYAANSVLGASTAATPYAIPLSANNLVGRGTVGGPRAMGAVDVAAMLETGMVEVAVSGTGEKAIAVLPHTKSILITPVGGNLQIGAVTGLALGRSIMVFLRQDTADRTVTLGSSNAILATPDALDMLSGANKRTYAILTGGRTVSGAIEPTFHKVEGPA